MSPGRHRASCHKGGASCHEWRSACHMRASRGVVRATGVSCHKGGVNSACRRGFCQRGGRSAALSPKRVVHVTGRFCYQALWAKGVAHVAGASCHKGVLVTRWEVHVAGSSCHKGVTRACYIGAPCHKRGIACHMAASCHKSYYRACHKGVAHITCGLLVTRRVVHVIDWCFLPQGG